MFSIACRYTKGYTLRYAIIILMYKLKKVEKFVNIQWQQFHQFF